MRTPSPCGALPLPLALLLCAAGAAAQIAPQVTPVFQGPITSLANSSLVLSEGSPQFTLFSTINSSCTQGAGGVTSCSPLHWLAVALSDVYEIDASGQPVAERSGSAVLYTANLQWSSQQTQIGPPPVPVLQASMILPYQAQLPACPGGGDGSVAVASTPEVPAGRGVTLSLQLFGGLTNLTYFNSTQELLPGNLKWSVTADNWPFCDPSHSLRHAFNLLPANASDAVAAGEPTVVRPGTEIQAEVAQQEARLTGTADPESVPVQPDAGGSQQLLPDPASAHAQTNGGGAPSDASGVGGSGRRLLQRRGFGRLVGRRPATRPSSPAPTTPARPTRPYFPNGGTSRPRFPTSGAAISTLPFAAAQRPFLASRFFYNRPVYGFGRRPFLPFTTFLFFPLLLGAGLRSESMYAPMVEVQRTVILNNNTLANVSVEVPPVQPNGIQPVLVTVPYFQGSAFYDPVVAIDESDLAVREDIEEAINDVMAYDEEGNPNAAMPRAGSPAALLLQAIVAAAVAAAVANFM